jgi:MSHA biogenesis protein MshP
MMKTGSRIEECGLRAGIKKLGTIVAERKDDGEPVFPRSSILTPHSCQSGFSLISAIFLLVVIAALGTFAVTLSTTQNQSQAMDIMAARGYQAALAGVEWATFNVSQQPANSPAAWTGCVTGATVTVGGNLAPFTVTVNCTAASAVEGTNTLWVYSVSSLAKTADSPGGINYVEQVATAKLAQ